MIDLLRDSALGQLLRLITKDRILRYPEGVPGFVLPESFNLETKTASQGEAASIADNEQNDPQNVDLEALDTLHRGRSISNLPPRLYNTNFRVVPSLEEGTNSREIKPTLTKDGKLLVTWYSTDDPENPQNWSTGKKLWVSFVIWYVVKCYFNDDIHR